jgi:hypothetical protein
MKGSWRLERTKWAVAHPAAALGPVCLADWWRTIWVRGSARGRVGGGGGGGYVIQPRDGERERETEMEDINNRSVEMLLRTGSELDITGYTKQINVL